VSEAAGGPRIAIAAAVVIHEGRVLVQTRPEGKAYAGSWEFPGGKIEADEDAPACAVRECREELGLVVRPLAPLDEVEWEYPGTAVHVTFVECEPAGDVTVHAHDGQQVRWANAETLPELEFLPANASVLALLAERLTS
jgi:8-oxo-dGTP diphosphatase